MTFKGLQKLVKLQSNPEQTKQFEKLRERFNPADYNNYLKYRINMTETSTEPNTKEHVFECDKKDACDSVTTL